MWKRSSPKQRKGRGRKREGKEENGRHRHAWQDLIPAIFEMDAQFHFQTTLVVKTPLCADLLIGVIWRAILNSKRVNRSPSLSLLAFTHVRSVTAYIHGTRLTFAAAVCSSGSPSCCSHC
jgi:hypothetical protein